MKTVSALQKARYEYKPKLPAVLAENTPENIQIIIDEATRLSTLVNDVLDLSKLQAGVVSLKKRVYNLTSSVRGILTRYTKMTDYHIVFYASEESISVQMSSRSPRSFITLSTMR